MKYENAWKELTSRLTAKGYDPKTIEVYDRVLKRFGEYMAEKGMVEVSALMKEHIQEFADRERQRLTPKGLRIEHCTANQNLRFLGLFLLWLRDENYTYENLSKVIVLAKEPQRLPRNILTAIEAKKILKMPDQSTAMGYRDRTMLEILYSTGIRRQEIMNLTIHDVDTKDGYLRINQGKGKKDRVVPLGRIACQYLENYIYHVRPNFLKKDPSSIVLFLSFHGNVMSKVVVGAAVRKYTKLAGIKKNVTPHTFRHTCATLMIKNKANIRYVQELLGHESIETTQIYTHLTITDLKEVHKRCHPRERDKP